MMSLLLQYMHTVLYSGKEETVVIESSMMQDSQSDTEGKAQDRAEHSPLLTEEDTSSEETKKLSLKTTTHPQVPVHVNVKGSV